MLHYDDSFVMIKFFIFVVDDAFRNMVTHETAHDSNGSMHMF